MSGPSPVLVLLGLTVGAACVGSIDRSEGSPGGAAGAPGSGGSPNLPAPPTAAGWQPVRPCEPLLPRRVTRLQDRHLANAVRDLLGLASAPEIDTSTGDGEA